MIKAISKNHKIIKYVIIATFFFAVLIGLILIYLLFQSKLKPNAENLAPLKEIPSPTQAQPENNPFKTKTNPFKDIKTNPFR